MKKLSLRAILHDTAMALLAGLIGTAGLFLLFFLVGLLCNRFDLRSALVLVRGGLLIFGALELFVCAGLLLWPKNGEKIRGTTQWNRFFKVFGLFPILLVTAVSVLTVASFVDYYLYF